MTIDKRFALLAKNGDVLYPYVKSEQQGARRVGFAVSAPGEKDAKGIALYTNDLAEVIRRVVHDGWNVRAKQEFTTAGKRREGGYGLGKIAIGAAWVAPEFAGLVADAKVAIQRTPRPRPLGNSTNEVPLTQAVDQVDALTADEFLNALQRVAPELTPSQRDMLKGHATSPDGRLSMEAIAALGGYDSYHAGNSQYGAMAGKFANARGIGDLPNQTMLLAQSTGDSDALGHFVWQIRPALVEALYRFGWLSSSDDLALSPAVAEAELREDPVYQGASVTTRQAMVEARIGQGAYRRDMLKLWGHACSLTGLAIEEVLVASHAKSWKGSNARERLDPYNGLLLAGSIDKLFDRGLISFDVTGRLLTKPAITDDHLRTLGVSRGARLRFLKQAHQAYLAAHRAAHHFSV